MQFSHAHATQQFVFCCIARACSGPPFWNCSTISIHSNAFFLLFYVIMRQMMMLKASFFCCSTMGHYAISSKLMKLCFATKKMLQKHCNKIEPVLFCCSASATFFLLKRAFLLRCNKKSSHGPLWNFSRARNATCCVACAWKKLHSGPLA